MIKISELTPKEAPLSVTDLLEISEETPDGFVTKSVTGSDIQQSVGKYGTEFGINTTTPTHSLQVESEEQCIILAKTTNITGGGVALMDGNTSDEFQVGVGAFANRLCLRSNTELFKFPTADGTSGQAIVTDGSGNLSFDSVSSGVTLVTKKTNISATGSGIVLIASHDISSYIGEGMLQVTAMYRKTLGSQAYVPRLYVNSSASLSGATLIATLGTISVLNHIGDNIVNFSIDSSNNLYALNVSGTLFSRYGIGVGTVVALPSPCYLIWAGQVTNSADIAVLLN